jgi:hypothetical protein
MRATRPSLLSAIARPLSLLLLSFLDISLLTMGIKAAWPFLIKNGLITTDMTVHMFKNHCTRKYVLVDLLGSFYDLITTSMRRGDLDKMIHCLQQWLPRHAILVVDGRTKIYAFEKRLIVHIFHAI